MLAPSVMLALLLLQQPHRLTPAERAARADAYDSSKAAISHVAVSVGEVRSALGVYRQAVFHGTDGEVLHNADYLGVSCRTVDSVARAMVGRVCRDCAGEARVQAALDGYRQGLPDLSRGMTRCTARIRELQRSKNPVAGLRRDVRVIGNAVVLTLRRYGARLAVALDAMNLTPPPAPPPTPPGRR